MRADATLRAYLPSEEMDLGRWPDRRFFWGVLSTLRRDWVEQYTSEAVSQRDGMHLIKRMDCKAIKISGGWKQKLLAHDFASRQKGKCTLLLTLVQATAAGRASS